MPDDDYWKVEGSAEDPAIVAQSDQHHSEAVDVLRAAAAAEQSWLIAVEDADGAGLRVLCSHVQHDNEDCRCAEAFLVSVIRACVTSLEDL